MNLFAWLKRKRAPRARLTVADFLDQFDPAELWDTFVERQDDEAFEADVEEVAERWPALGLALEAARAGETPIEITMWTGVLYVLMALAAAHDYSLLEQP